MNLEKEDSRIASATIKIEHFHYPPDFPVLLSSHSLSYLWTQTAMDLTSVNLQFSSVAQSCPTLCDRMNHSCQASLSITNSGVHSNSRPSSRWCHPAISSSVVPFSSCPQSLPASESFPMSQIFARGGQSTRVSALASFLPKKPRADLL